MLQRERLEEIRKIIRIKKEVSVSELSRQYNVTEETIRRDLDKLKAEGLVSRTYGGAVLAADNSAEKLDYILRAQTHVEEKHLIAELASTVIPEKAAIGADASSTVMETIRTIGKRPEITLLTNSVRVLGDIAQIDLKLILTGGAVNRGTCSMQGTRARQSLNDYFLDIVLISCKALNLSGGIFDSNEEEALWKKRLIERGQKIILLADHSKFDRSAFVEIMSLDQVDILVTDREPSPEWKRILKEKNVRLICRKE